LSVEEVRTILTHVKTFHNHVYLSTVYSCGLRLNTPYYIELKIRLAAGLRRRRQEKGLSQLGLATRLQSSQSRIAKMEAGDPSVSLDLLIRSLISLGISERELSRIITTPRAA
jgi:hypothetical protein